MEELNIDEFLPIGADSVATGDKPQELGSIFKKPENLDLAFLEDFKKEKSDEPKKEDDEPELIKTDDPIEDPLGLNTDESNKGRKKIEKDGLAETVKKFIEKGVFKPFEDGDDLEKYTLKDYEELIEANLEHRESTLRETIQKEMFDSLPEEIQLAVEYVQNGGKDIKNLLKALAITEEIRELDPKQDADIIVRQYLMSTRFGTEAEIEAQIQEWEEIGKLEAKASTFKPKLDAMNEAALKENLKKQEEFKRQQQETAEKYKDNIYNTLKTGELNGLKLDKKTQNNLFTELTSAKYDSLAGRKTNLLGHLLEKYQFVEPRFDLIAEATWLLNDPEGYKKALKEQGATAEAGKTARLLKGEESRKLGSSSNTMDEDDNKNKNLNSGLKRKVNFFARN